MAKKTLEGTLSGKGRRIAICAAKWNEEFVGGLIRGALEALEQNGVGEDQITVVRASGSYELLVVMRAIAESKQYDGIVALGVVLQGATEHHRVINDTLIHGFTQLMLDFGIPIGMGVIPAASEEDARVRSQPGEHNRGREASLAVLETVDLLGKIEEG